MTETNVKIIGFSNKTLNGKNISSKGFDLEYDGNDAYINSFSDGKLYYKHLNKKQLINLFNSQTINTSLDKRIKKDLIYLKPIKLNKTKSIRKTTNKSIKNRLHNKYSSQTKSINKTIY
jgi:hypothetical protein